MELAGNVFMIIKIINWVLCIIVLSLFLFGSGFLIGYQTRMREEIDGSKLFTPYPPGSNWVYHDNHD